MFELFKSKPTGTRHVVVSDGKPSKIPKVLTHGSALQRHHGSAVKRGMWVRYDDSVGILMDLEAGDIATVMIVDPEQGANVAEVHCPAISLRQAYLEEIPPVRIKDTPADVLYLLGYRSAP